MKVKPYQTLSKYTNAFWKCRDRLEIEENLNRTITNKNTVPILSSFICLLWCPSWWEPVLMNFTKSRTKSSCQLLCHTKTQGHCWSALVSVPRWADRAAYFFHTTEIRKHAIFLTIPPNLVLMKVPLQQYSDGKCTWTTVCHILCYCFCCAYLFATGHINIFTHKSSSCWQLTGVAHLSL